MIIIDGTNILVSGAFLKCFSIVVAAMAIRKSTAYVRIETKKNAKIRNLSNQNPSPAFKTEREITNIINNQNTKRTYGQQSEHLFPKRWSLSNRNRTKHNMNTRKVKRHRNSGAKNRQQRTTTKLLPWNGQ